MLRIGVFDSGIGGKAIANYLETRFPKIQIVIVDDHTHVPYGDKSASEILRLTDHAIQPLLQRPCDVIVLACNTATANAIDSLRAKYPHQKFIGIEPMIKPASLITKTRTIAICATSATLKSPHYKKLLQKYASGIKVIEPNCNSWAYMIEKNTINREEITKTIDDVCNHGADVIVLGCTHYHWVKGLIIESAKNRATILEPSEAIGSRIADILNLR